MEKILKLTALGPTPCDHAPCEFIINYDIKYRMGKELDGGENNDD